MAANAPPAQWLPAVSKLHLSLLAKLKGSFREQCSNKTQEVTRISVCRQRVTTSLAQ